MKALIGVTAFLNNETRTFRTKASYVEAIRKAGGTAIMLPINDDVEEVKEIVSVLDGVLIPGGPDLSPLLYGEEPIRQVTYTCQRDDLYEISIIKEAIKQKKPVMGICRGAQAINVSLGGTLIQDIPEQTDSIMCHYQDNLIRSERTHFVNLQADSMIARISGATKIHVNSFHHQAIKEVAPCLKVVGHASDGIIEAVESEDGMILGLQWHPECLFPYYTESERLFCYFVEMAKNCRAKSHQC